VNKTRIVIADGHRVKRARGAREPTSLTIGLEGTKHMITRIRKAMEERDEGFTLIELLVVVIIIGILAAIAIPVFLNQRKKAHDAAAKSDLKALATAEESYLVDNPDTYTTDISGKLAGPDNEGFKGTNDVTTKVVTVSTNKGYCAAAKAGGSDKVWWYDSEDGGLQKGSTSGSGPGTKLCTGSVSYSG
jgi:type IV pilus assembly protein PilA